MSADELEGGNDIIRMQESRHVIKMAQKNGLSSLAIVPGVAFGKKAGLGAVLKKRKELANQFEECEARQERSKRAAL